MRSKLISAVSLIVLLAAMTTYAEVVKPTRLKESIPADTPPDVKRQIERLYSFKPLTRIDAVRKLANFGEDARDAVPFLIEMMHDDTLIMTYDNESDVRTALGVFVGEEVASTLGAIGAPAVDALIAALRDENNTVRKNAVIALGLTGDKRAVEPLLLMVDNKDIADPVINTYVHNTLKNLTGQDFGDDRIEWNKWWIKNKGKFK